MPTHVPVPTPRITRISPRDGLKYAFTIATYRRGGAFIMRVTVTDPSLSINAPDPIDADTGQPVSPVRTVRLPRSRPYWHDVVQACAALVALSMWDPRLDPRAHRPRPMWRASAKDYAHKTEYEETVLLALPYLLNPKLGRRTRERTDAVTCVPHATARLRRCMMLASCVAKMQALLEPVQAMLVDARRMKGYTSSEVEQLRHLFGSAGTTCDTLRRVLATDAATLTTAPTRSTPLIDITQGFDEVPDAPPRDTSHIPRFSFAPESALAPAPAFAFGTLVAEAP